MTTHGATDMVLMRRLGKEHWTNEELVKLAREIEGNPDNRNPPGSLWLFKPKAQKKLDAIARCIQANIAAARKGGGG